jgi:hypothetical protein
VIFPSVWDVAEGSGVTTSVAGWRQVDGRRGIVDVRGGGYLWVRGGSAECSYGPPPPGGCWYYTVAARVRYVTADGGRHWRAARASKLVQEWRDGESTYWDSEVPVRPCRWAGKSQSGRWRTGTYEFGNYCEPADLWLIDR